MGRRRATADAIPTVGDDIANQPIKDVIGALEPTGNMAGLVVNPPTAGIMKASRQVMSAPAGPTTTNLEGGFVMAKANSNHNRSSVAASADDQGSASTNAAVPTGVSVKCTG